MSDLIRREDAIRVLSQRARILQGEYGDLGGACSGAMKIIESLPSAEPEPERKKGKWIEISWSEPDPNVCCTSYSIQSAKCSICGKYHTTPYLHNLVYFPFCPNCGAKLDWSE